MVYVVENDDIYWRIKRQWSATAEVLIEGELCPRSKLLAAVNASLR
jgi:hypothetical protein